MSHPSARCTCGRIIHLPKGASRGDSWTCHDCGRTWYVTPHGDIPLHVHRSKAPPRTRPMQATGPVPAPPDDDWGTTALVMGGVAAVICAPTLCLLGAGLVGGLWAYKHFN